MQDNNRQSVEAYLQAFEERDLPRCMGFFAEDADLAFHTGIYRGKAAIEQWHKDRFAADMRVIRVDKIRVQGEMVSVDAFATSNRLKAWRFGALGGTATFRFQEGKINTLGFTLRMALPIEDWR